VSRLLCLIGLVHPYFYHFVQKRELNVDSALTSFILGRGLSMKKLSLALALILVATVCWANTRDWKTARVINSSETQVTGGMKGDTNTLHYTIETDDAIYFVDYAYKPGQRGGSGAPDIAQNITTKIAVEGKTAYIVDVNGREVKLRVTKTQTKE
jgi:hypothetical protein